jgi:transaldolase
LETETKATEQLHHMGQSLWLDNITRGLLTSGTLKRSIREVSITGLTSNPSIFDHVFSPIIDGAAMSLSSLSVIGNALQLRKVRL